eukprot:CAMPEP_0117601400 /NCGR_PEP_ID=MMETSP0784-20121206/77013_1 /TAXON_ID=39447 /ORGANISM="" /LENGTH=118 /DNA_ID=CAMNT_0005404121 /DNA_START=14 /DNA_END=366 /DNA_ORIENTATION=-
MTEEQVSMAIVSAAKGTNSEPEVDMEFVVSVAYSFNEIVTQEQAAKAIQQAIHVNGTIDVSVEFVVSVAYSLTVAITDAEARKAIAESMNVSEAAVLVDIVPPLGSPSVRRLDRRVGA